MKPTAVTRWTINFSSCAVMLFASGCANGLGEAAIPDRSRTPFLVDYSLAPDASNKTGVQAQTNTGAQIFAKSTLTTLSGGLSGFGGTVPFPRWVRVTWREGVTPGKYWTTGTVVGDHTIDVQARIPAKFFEMAKLERTGAIKLLFRIKDDKVLFAWCVQKDSTLGNVYVNVLNDGDFKPAKIRNGVVEDPGWEK